MRRTIFILILALLIICCTNENCIQKLLALEDIDIAKIIEYHLIDNSTFYISFDREVELKELIINDEKISFYGINKEFYIKLPYQINKGEKIRLSLTGKTSLGNTTRASFTLVGKNENIPKLILNEISTKGTASSPDRIEIVALSNGNLAGVKISDGYNGSEKYSYTFSDVEVNRYDIIVLYWDRSTNERIEAGEIGNIYYFNANSPSTLTSTYGSVVIQEEEDGAIIDAFVYYDLNAENENEKFNKLKVELKNNDQWQDNPMDSSLHTASRSFSRLPSFQDTNTNSDWFITKARSSTFGKLNIYTPYEE